MLVHLRRQIIISNVALVILPQILPAQPEFNSTTPILANNSRTCYFVLDISPVNMANKAHLPDLTELRHDLHSLSVPALFTDSSDFDRYAQSYNRVFSYKPTAICVPTTDEDISNAIRCAHDHGLKVQPKSGGHSYGAFSSGGQDGSIVIHMKNFNSVELDTKTNIAVVGAGARLGRLANELFRQGKRAVPHGTIKNVGVGGHFSHGGYGYQSRAWGLSLDTIYGMDVVLANGRLVHVTAEREPELWFVCPLCLISFSCSTITYETDIVIEPGFARISRFFWYHHAISPPDDCCAGSPCSLLA